MSDDQLMESSQPSVEGFYRLVRANRIHKVVEVSLALAAAVLAVVSIILGGLLREHRAQEAARAQDRWETPAWQRAVRVQVDSALADRGFATSMELYFVKTQLDENSKSLDAVNDKLQRVLGRLEDGAQP